MELPSRGEAPFIHSFFLLLWYYFEVSPIKNEIDICMYGRLFGLSRLRLDNKNIKITRTLL